MTRVLLLVWLFLGSGWAVVGQDAEESSQVFSPEEWQNLEGSVDRGLAFLATLQDSRTGCIGTQSVANQPALTSLAVMACLSRGHQPGQGPYGKLLEHAIYYVLSTQDQYGFFTIDKSYARHGTTYGHAISGVMLAEVLGMTDHRRNVQIDQAIRKGLSATIKLQQRHRDVPSDAGGWRYVKRAPNGDADLSVTTWHLLFLRAAKNANYDVPRSYVKEASNYVKSCYDPETQQFGYMPNRSGSLSMTGAGTLCMFLAGEFDDRKAQAGLQSLDAFDFRKVGDNRWRYYACYHSSQAASQAGGKVRISTLREIAEFLLPLQEPNGSWPSKGFQSVYSTSLSILSLTPAYQILPIYQQ